MNGDRQTPAHELDWQQFWSGRAQGSEHRFRDPLTASVIGAYWQGVLKEVLQPGAEQAVVDLACGEGEVLQLADRVTESTGLDLASAVCADISPDAVQLACDNVRTLPVAGIVTDCARLPFGSGSFDVVTSQYGLEYAGPDAVGEAGRILAPGGHFHALIHCADGAVSESCGAVADLLGCVIDAGLLHKLETYARVVPQAMAGAVPPTDGRACADALRQALEQVAMAAGGVEAGPARDHVVQLIRDTQTLAARLPAFSQQDVASWIAGQRADLEAFHGRMKSMLQVAQTQADMEGLSLRLQGEGLSVEPVRTLDHADLGKPLAWVLEGVRES